MDLKDLEALSTIITTLQPFETKDQSRILRWVVEKLELNETVHAHSKNANIQSNTQPNEDYKPTTIESYSHVAELLAATHARTDVQRALAVATYLQFHDGLEQLNGRQINAALKDLGHQCSNITDTITALKKKKPALMVQLSKSGSTKQAHKLYKVTHAGKVAVITMIKDALDNEDQ